MRCLAVPAGRRRTEPSVARCADCHRTRIPDCHKNLSIDIKGASVWRARASRCDADDVVAFREDVLAAEVSGFCGGSSLIVPPFTGARYRRSRRVLGVRASRCDADDVVAFREDVLAAESLGSLRVFAHRSSMARDTDAHAAKDFVAAHAGSFASAEATPDAGDTPSSAARPSRSNRGCGRTHVPLDCRPAPN